MNPLLCLPSLFLLLSVDAAGAAVLPPIQPKVETVQGFVANAGQIQGPARYYAVGQGSAVYFEPTAVVLDRAPGASDQRGVVLRVEFPASPRRPTLMAREQQESRVNWFLGRDPSRWRAQVPTYGAVRYAGIAPGADIVYRFKEGQLEYDIELAPGADISRAILRYDGAESFSVGRHGELLIHTRAGTLMEKAPFLYQEREGERIPVVGGFRPLSRNQLGFWAAGYDPALPLVIDPRLVWSSFLGGSDVDLALAEAIGSDGAIYIVGSTRSPNYPTSSGAYRRTAAGQNDVVVTKMSANGSGIVWSTYIGGTGSEYGWDVAVDAGGSAYVGGYTGSTDYPTTTGAFRMQHCGGAYDVFMTKISPGGNSLTYSTYVGGNGDDNLGGLVVDGSGNAILAGVTSSPNFPTTAGVVKSTWVPNLLDGSDGFVTKLNSNGSGLVYSTFLGAGGNDAINGIALDAQGRATVVGKTLSSGFVTTSGAYDRTFGGNFDGFLTTLSSGASSYVYSTLLGGSNEDTPYGVALGSDGSMYVAGYTASTDFPTTSGAFQGALRGGLTDAFVSKLAPGGASMAYSTYLGGGGNDYVYGLAVTSGTAYVIGSTTSGDFPTISGALDASANGGTDAFITGVSSSGSALVYSTYLGGSGADVGRDLAFDANKYLVAVGYTASGEFPTTAGAFDGTHNSPGTPDVFTMCLEVPASTQLAVDDLGPGSTLFSNPRPNPFSTTTTVQFSLKNDGPVTLRVLDVRGRVIQALVERSLPAGSHSASWNGVDRFGHNAPAGIYFLELRTPTERISRRVVFMRS